MIPTEEVESARLKWRARSVLFYAIGAVLLATGVAARTPVPLFLALPFLLAPLGAALLGPRRATAVLEWNVSGTEADVTVRGRIVPSDPALQPREMLLRIERPSGLLVRAPPRVEYARDALSFELSWRAHEPLITQVRIP